MTDSLAIFDTTHYCRRGFGVKDSDGPEAARVVVEQLDSIIDSLRDKGTYRPVFVFDPLHPAQTWRHELASSYKAQRPPIENRNEWETCVTRVFSRLQERYSPLSVYQSPKFEADDIIGTLAYENRANAPVIVSVDKDFLQCVQWGAVVYRTDKDSHSGRHWVTRETWGHATRIGKKNKAGQVTDYTTHVAPECWVDYLTLVGDTSDNIPGVPGLGDAGAIKLIRLLHDPVHMPFSLESLYWWVDAMEMTDRIGKRISAEKPWLQFRQRSALVMELSSILDKGNGYLTKIYSQGGNRRQATMRDALRDSRAHLLVSRALVSLKLDVPLDECVSELSEVDQIRNAEF